MSLSVKKFLLKGFLFGSPFFLIAASYFYFDPFKVLYHYNIYYISGNTDGWVSLNKDYTSMENYLNLPKEYIPNSFIFGGSRSWFYLVKDWEQYLTADARCYHFDASKESLYGIERKMYFVTHNERHRASLKNVLIVLDAEIFESPPNNTDQSYRKHPLLSGENWFSFEARFFTSYFINLDFMTAFLDFKFSGKLKPYMVKNKLLDSRIITYEPLTNEFTYAHYDSIIECDPNQYYTPAYMATFYGSDKLSQKASGNALGAFYDRDKFPKKTSPPLISKEHMALLKSIKCMMDSTLTDYRIVIGPLFDQAKLNPIDYQYLVNIFGKTKVFDYSGKNAITDNVYNYYEAAHYRPPITRQIMKDIYSAK